MKQLGLVALFLVLLMASGSSYADSATLYPSDDADVWQYLPDDNRGSEQSFHVGCDASGFWRNSLVRFNLSDLSGATINSATLRLMVISSWGDFPTDQVRIARNDTDWDEMTVTWNSRPGFAEIIPVSAPAVLDWWEIDVTEWIQGIVDGTDPNFGFQIYQNDNDYAGFSMRTKEGVMDPELVLEYTPLALYSTTFGRIKTMSCNN